MNTSDSGPAHQAGEAGPRAPSGAARLFPKVTFGLGAAVLAGVVVVSVPPVPLAARAAGQPVMATTAGLGPAINAVGASAIETTCCGNT
jgi:hypothetical protein